jgi:acyl-coenzyme A synthetase/AMP-(fatty) acid ligase
VHLSSQPTQRFYRTGDRVLEMPNGELAFLGRSDHQIKVLGHRVELGEVESALRRNPGIVEAVAVGWPLQDGIAQGIVAFVTPPLKPEEVIADVRALLPDYMVPKSIIGLDEMPHNASGKIDRRALQDRLANLAGTNKPTIA